MSLHIGANPHEIAETVLISGDPLRAKYIATKMLTEVSCYNEIRGMLGFTGWYHGKRVSVQGTGMGIPSTAIYVHELIHEYRVKKIIRIGTCGALQPTLELGQIILASAAYTDSNTAMLYHDTRDFASKADTELLMQAREMAHQLAIIVEEGIIFSTDTFYSEELNRWDPWIQRGLLGIEMEASILYSLAAKNHVKALSILSVSDNLITKTVSSSKAREEVSLKLLELALEIA